MESNNYKKFLLMLVLSFIIMYGVMFLNVARNGHIYISLTRLYMTLLMICPMALLMLAMMPKMYPSKKMNAIIISGSVAVFFTALIFLRSQTFVGDVQFMKAMIPHHSSAILTSSEATFTDPEVQQLASEIIKAQEKEIMQMKEMLQRLEKKQ